MASIRELRESLQALSEQSMKTTRQLDDVYYSILEKVSVLQSTISNLQDLSSMTRDLHKEFQSETGAFESEMKEQMVAFGGFDNPKQRIGDFETRVKTSKAKADELSARLESARARVLALESEEKEYQDMVSRMLLTASTFMANAKSLLQGGFE
jgi:chromosome segregation ATPase